MRLDDPSRFGPLALPALVAFEGRLGESVPNEYRHFLLEHNGGKPLPSGFRINEAEGDDSIHHGFYGLHDGPAWSRLDLNWEAYRGRIQAWLLPIADDPLGNAICLGITGEARGRIYFWDHERELLAGYQPTELAPSFKGFVESLFEVE